MTIREQATKWGHAPVGKLKRVKNWEILPNVKSKLRSWVDEEGTMYDVDKYGKLICIAGEDWVM